MVPGAGLETPTLGTPLIVWVRLVLFCKGLRVFTFVHVWLVRFGWHTVWHTHCLNRCPLVRQVCYP